MDQQKIGRFIAQMRKEKSLTQRELADTLCISDKTVSKWENGKGMPEVSLMMPLCEALDITANELLSGERLSQDDYIRKAEENIMTLVKEREESKKKIMLSAIVAVITIIGGTALVTVSGVFEMELWARILLIGLGLVVIFGGLFVAAALEMEAGTFECRHCKHRFVPTAGAYIAGPHSLTTRYLKCPECGKKSYCKRRLTH
ncbi:MAG: helix-turn-helix transcriptional regulator [Oscillospiraceae bacterium]|nr:helix-turn-helix transcriptional regulator [Oscillospiraceae bacterium]